MIRATEKKFFYQYQTGSEQKSKNKQARKFDISTYRNHRNEELPLKSKIAVATGATLGALIPLMGFAKSQKTSPLNVNYHLKEMIGVSLGAVVAGTGVGILVDKPENKKQKINEGVFQFINAAVPTLAVIPALKVCEKIKPLNNIPTKIGTTFATLFAGMHLAAEMSNKINDPHDKVPDRKLTIKDAIANVDDAFGVFVVSKMPFAKSLHLEKLLAPIYAWCGYRAGESN
ncbi:MAG: hypothetical protein R3Y28_07595 [Candidatus Gastranaerophilales bacterium]